MSVTVVGAGVIGLTTGTVLRERGIAADIVAAEMPADTTSAAAGAIWYPLDALDDTRMIGWAEQTLRRLEELTATGTVLETEVLELHTGPQPPPVWADLVPGFTDAPDIPLPAGRQHAWAFSCLVIKVPEYLEWLTRRFRDLGGSIELRMLDDLEEAGDGVVVNCTGVGAHRLAHDPDVFPIRGQVIRIVNPGVPRCVIDDHHLEDVTYVFPRGDDCILGGSRQQGDWDRRVDDELTADILRRCAAIEPRVADPEIIDVRVGLRPGRPSVRLEAEPRGETTVIHNYGHAGSGHSLSWGCAATAADLVEAALG